MLGSQTRPQNQGTLVAGPCKHLRYIEFVFQKARVSFQKVLGSTCLSQRLVHPCMMPLLLPVSAGWCNARHLPSADGPYENKGSGFFLHQPPLLLISGNICCQNTRCSLLSEDYVISLNHISPQNVCRLSEFPKVGLINKDSGLKTLSVCSRISHYISCLFQPYEDMLV